MNIGEYAVIQPLGQGSFGQVYLVQQSSRLYALKLEAPGHPTHLDIEHYLLCLLRPSPHFPQVYKAGRSGSSLYLVMELLGPSLEAVMRERKGKVEFGTWQRVWKWGLGALETLHGMGYVHRDVKPANLAVDMKGERVVLFDLGLGKAFLNEKTGEHVPDSDCQSLAGTLLFASLNVLRGISHTPRDDLESLLLSLVYLFSGGHLPWKCLHHENKARKFYRTLQVASETSVETLCAGLPVGILESLRYARGLKYGDMPNYSYLLEIAERCKEDTRPERELSTKSLPEVKTATSRRKKPGHTPSLAPVVLPLSPEPTEVLDWTTLCLSPRHRRISPLPSDILS